MLLNSPKIFMIIMILLFYSRDFKINTRKQPAKKCKPVRSYILAFSYWNDQTRKAGRLMPVMLIFALQKCINFFYRNKFTFL